MCNSLVTVDPVICIICEKDITESISDNFYRDPVQTYKQYTCPHCQSLLDVEVIPVPYFRLSIPVGRGIEARPTPLAVDCALCHCSTVILSDGVHCIECGRVYKSHSH